MTFDLSLPFVFVISCSRLIPVLVNGMKYSEIDIILLKVSLWSLFVSVTAPGELHSVSA